MPIVKGIRRFHSNIVSSRQVATEISNLVSGSNVEQSGRSSRPVRKRVNNAERRKMLESFVNEYRAMNMGKFPSPTSAQKEVGGGYYSIKKMLQEMEYSSKMSPVEKTMESSSSSVETPNGQINSGQNLSGKNTDIGNNSIPIDNTHNLATESDEQLEQNPRDDNLIFKATESDEKLEQNPRNDNLIFKETESNEKLEQNSRDDTLIFKATESDEKLEQNSRDDNLIFKDSETKVEKPPDEIRNITRDMGEEDNELRKQASLWGNLKSLANGFINMWKK